MSREEAPPGLRMLLVPEGIDPVGDLIAAYAEAEYGPDYHATLRLEYADALRYLQRGLLQEGGEPDAALAV